MLSVAPTAPALADRAYWVVCWLDVNDNGQVDPGERVVSRGVHWSRLGAADVAENARLTLVAAGYRTGFDGRRGDLRALATPLPTDRATLEAVIETLEGRRAAAETGAWARVGV